MQVRAGMSDGAATVTSAIPAAGTEAARSSSHDSSTSLNAAAAATTTTATTAAVAGTAALFDLHEAPNSDANAGMSISMDTDIANARFSLGMLYHQLRQYASAEANLVQCLEERVELLGYEHGTIRPKVVVSTLG